MQSTRRTAVVSLSISGPSLQDVLGLDTQREYDFALRIDGKLDSTGQFRSPLGDAKWREVTRALSESTAGAGDDRRYNTIRAAGLVLYQSLSHLSETLASFLLSESEPRRIVIDSLRPEIHQLPWEAMVNSQWKSLANLNISIVRSTNGFNQEPDVCSAPLHFMSMFGPGTEKRTISALKKLKQIAERRKVPKFTVAIEQQPSLPGDWDDRQAEVIHIEAHGDFDRAGVVLEDKTAVSDALVKRLGNRKMVLLWSCYSSMINSRGKSLALDLHNEGNVFVLAFATPLQYERSGEIADQFYVSVFAPRDALDPESAILKERRRLFMDQAPSCDWASMMLWLRQPLDMSAVVLDGPRLPKSEWLEQPPEVDKDATDEWPQRFERAIREKAVPGRAMLIPNEEIQEPLPYTLADSYSGAVIHLRGEDALKQDTLFNEWKVDLAKIKSRHPADRFLKVLEELTTYSRSLLIWSGITKREIQLVELLSETPKNVAIVLVSPDNVSAGPGIIIVDSGKGASQPEKTFIRQTPSDPLEALDGLEEAGLYKEAIEQFTGLEAQYERWPDSQKVRYQSKGYWSFIRLNQKQKAESCIESVERLDKPEGLLLRGNFVHRKGLYDKAREAYAEALEQAQITGNNQAQGRAKLELAYMASQLKDPRLSEEYFLEAIALLQQAQDNLEDSRWRSALGRALRDYAHLIVGDPARVKECASYLQRALAIHAIDDRLSQVAVALQTRGKLARAQGKDENAEADFKTAASILIKNGNQAGWANAMLEMAQFSFNMQLYSQCFAILKNAYRQLEKQPDDFKTEKGLIALLAARACWRIGKIRKANNWANAALSMLPEARRQERVDATNLKDMTISLMEPTKI